MKGKHELLMRLEESSVVTHPPESRRGIPPSPFGYVCNLGSCKITESLIRLIILTMESELTLECV